MKKGRENILEKEVVFFCFRVFSFYFRVGDILVKKIELGFFCFEI